MKYVLFVCNHNAGRSQMAQAFFERYAPPDIRAESAGSDPADRVWPEVTEVMREVGIDLADRRPRRLLPRDAAARRLGGDHGLRRRLPVRPDHRRGLGDPRPGWQAGGGGARDPRRDRGSRGASWWRPSSTPSAPTAPPTRRAYSDCCPLWPRSSPAALDGEIRACADAILDDYDDVPVRSYVMTLAHRRTRECLRAEHCDALGGALDAMDRTSLCGGRAAAEGLAAFALVFAGCGAIIANQQYDGALGAVGVSLVFGLIIMVMVYATGHLSGAHINPSVTDRVHPHPPLLRRATRSPTSPPSSPAPPPRALVLLGGLAKQAGAPRRDRADGRGRQRVPLRGGAHRVPDVRDHGRRDRHARGRRGGGDRHRRRRSASTRCSAGRSPARR